MPIPLPDEQWLRILFIPVAFSTVSYRVPSQRQNPSLLKVSMKMDVLPPLEFHEVHESFEK